MSASSLSLAFPLWNVAARPVEWFAYGRGALRSALRRLQADGAPASLLLPGFICASVTDAARDAGWRMSFYDLGPHLAPSVEQLEAARVRETRAVLIVNYFGLPCPTASATAAWCRANGLVLIEDNCHGYLSADGTSPLGLTGDLAILSLRKTLPIPVGAALIANNPGALRAKAGERLAYHLEWGLALKRGVRLVGEYLDAPLRRTRSVRPVRAGDEESGAKYGLGMDRLSVAMTHMVDAARVVRNRRLDYASVVDEAARHSDATPLVKTLPEGVCPYAVPFVAADKPGAQRALRARRLRISDWPGASPAVPATEALRRLNQSLFLALLAY